MNDSQILAIDAGGTFFKSAIVSTEGTVFENTARSIPIDSNGPKENILAAYKDIIGAALSFTKEHGVSLSGIGISTPGPFDYNAGTSLMQHKFKSIYGINLREFFSDKCGIPKTMPVEFLHDVHAFILGESWNGNAKGFARVAGITLGTGIGFGCILDKHLLCNETGGPWLSLYKTPCGDGILEDYASARGIISEYCRLKKTASTEITAKELARRALENSDTGALEVYSKVGTLIGKSIAPILAEKKIECIVIGGQIARSFQLMEQSLKNELSDCGSLKKLAVAKNIDSAALAGAALQLLKNERNN